LETDKPAKKLNARESAFVREYLVDLNASQASIRAGYSDKTSRQIGARLLTKVHIQTALGHGMERRAAKTEVTQERVIKELLALATVDISEAFDDMGQMKPLKDIPEAVRRSLSAIEVNEIFAGQGEDKMAIGLAKKARFYDKTKALELLGRHLGMFVDKVQHSGPNGGPIPVTAVPLDMKSLIADPESYKALDVLARKLDGPKDDPSASG